MVAPSGEYQQNPVTL